MRSENMHSPATTTSGPASRVEGPLRGKTLRLLRPETRTDTAPAVALAWAAGLRLGEQRARDEMAGSARPLQGREPAHPLLDDPREGAPHLLVEGWTRSA